jgi:uncharacterized membrane protein YfcA
VTPGLDLALLLGAGVLAGYINTVAGAGSLVTLPALIFTGLDPAAANATNRIAVLAQTGIATLTFRRGGLRVGRLAWALAVPATMSAALGAWVSTLLNEQELGLAIAIAMVVFLFLSLIRRKPRADVDVDKLPEPPKLRLSMVVAFAAIGFWAGFLQVGVGIVVLLYFALVHDTSLVVANGVKVVVIFTLTFAALAVFVVQDQTIDLLRGGILAAGTAAGGALGARDTLKRGERFVRYVLAAAVGASAIKLAWDAIG